MNLHPDHLADLRRSGLNDETIAAMNVRSVLPQDVLGFENGLYACVDSVMEIPYPNIENFSRYKLFPPIETQHGTMRYFQAPQTQNHLYILPPIHQILDDFREPLLFVEGEKKAARAVQEKLPAIGFSGIWNWKERDTWTGIQELKPIPFADRQVEIVPDSDTWTRDDLQHAIFAFGKYLESRGAKVSAVLLLQSGAAKVGLDDYFLSHSLEDFQQEKRIGIKHPTLSQHRPWYDGWKRRVDQKRRRETPTHNEECSSDHELKALAQPVLNEPDVLQLYRDEYRRLGYGGDLKPPMIVMLAATTRLLLMRRGAMPAHTGVVGPASIGKSYTVQTALSVFPKESFHTIDAGSPRALIYDPAPLKHRVLCFGESDSLPAGEDNPAASAVRNLCQDHYLHYAVTIKDPESGQFVTKEIVKEGPTVLMTTAVRFIGGQLGTRLFLVEVPEDAQRLQQALATQAQLEIQPPTQPNQALIAYQGLLQRSAPIDVIVPFAPILSEEIGKSVNASRILRDYQRLISLIKAVAIIRFPHRKRDRDGRLVATVDDYAAVFDLVAETYEAAITETSRGVRSLVKAVAEMEEAKSNVTITFNAIAKKLNVHREQVRRWASRAIRQGWLINEEERKNYPAKLTTVDADPLPQSAGLPDPAFLRVRCDSVTSECEPPAAEIENFTSSNGGMVSVTESHPDSVPCDAVTTDVTEVKVQEKLQQSNRSESSDWRSVTVSHEPRKDDDDGGNDADSRERANGAQHEPDFDAQWAKIKAEHAARRAH